MPCRVDNSRVMEETVSHGRVKNPTEVEVANPTEGVIDMGENEYRRSTHLGDLYREPRSETAAKFSVSALVLYYVLVGLIVKKRPIHEEAFISK